MTSNEPWGGGGKDQRLRTLAEETGVNPSWGLRSAYVVPGFDASDPLRGK